MSPRIRARHPLPCVLESVPRTVWRVLLWFLLAASLPVHARQVDSIPRQAAADGSVSEIHPLPTNPSPPAEDPEEEPNPAATFKPEWVISSDSLGNIRQRIKVESDYAIGDSVRLGLLYGQGFIYYVPSKSGETEGIRDAGVTGQWHPNKVVRFEGMVGVSQTGTTIDSDGQPAGQAVIPITNVQATLTPAGDIVRLDLGFKRSIFDLSPQLVANRVIRNDLVVHPQIGLPSGWKFRELAEIGPVTRAGESNYRYNSEFTVARKLARNSELYSTFSILHYAQASNAGYFSPDLVQNLEGGWSTDVDRRTISLSLDLGLGAGHARAHGDTFGPWGVSGHAETDLTWKVRRGREVHASYEYYYDQSTPALESTQTGPWHMTVLTVSFRWARM